MYVAIQDMATTPKSSPGAAQPIRGTVIEAEIKVVVDAARPLPLVTALYAIETTDGVWLCSYYGMNRSNFDYLPQKGAVVDESRLGILFHSKQFFAKGHYQQADWEEFKKSRMVRQEAH